MNVSRGFMIVGSIYLILGVMIGIYMGGSGDRTLIPVHAHINLLGFTLMMVFGLTYKMFPAMGATMLARAHFWLHAVGGTALLAMLSLLLTGKIAETAMFPVAPIAELAVLLGVIAFAFNISRHAD